MKRTLCILCLFAAGVLTSKGFGASYERKSFDSKKNNNIKEKVNAITTTNAYGDIGVTTSSASFRVEKWAFLAGIDILFWQRLGEETDQSISSGVTNERIEGLVRSYDFDWEPGVRIMLGAVTPYDDWVVSLVYTHFSTDQLDNTIQDAAAGIAGSSTTAEFGSGAVTFDDDFNYIQFEMGRAYFISGRFVMHPQMGFEIAWVNLHQRFAFGANSTNQSFTSKNKVDFWGGGPRLGATMRMYLGDSFFFFGRAASSIQYGDFDINLDQQLNATTVQTLSMRARSYHTLVNHSELEIGAAFSLIFNDNKMRATFKLSYETQYWWRMNQAFQTNALSVVDYTRAEGDVMFQGVSFGIKVEL